MAGMTPSEARLAIAAEEVRTLPVRPLAALASGSTALGMARDSSDLDLVMVLEPGRAGDAFPGTDPLALRLFEEGGLGVFWVTDEVEGVEVNRFVYAPEPLRAHCRMEAPLLAWKGGSRVGDTGRGHAFDGTMLAFDRRVRSLGGGWLYERPALCRGRYWGGVPKQNFLGGIVPLAGPGWIEALSDETWEATVRQLVAEELETLHRLPTGLSVLNTHWTCQESPERFPAWLGQELADREAEWRKRLGG